ncbi:MAG: replication initiator protein A [Eubacteriales bacterium]|nr:replication initiator protein A [Eubacteriales bacterium]
MNEENVITTNEMNQEERMPFFRIPKAILTDEKYVGLSEGAMLLYGILLDRRSLSERNDWRDKKGDVFVYCTLETIQMTLRCAHQKATKLLMELEEVGLIRRKKQGLGRPAKIYVVDISALSA